MTHFDRRYSARLIVVIILKLTRAQLILPQQDKFLLNQFLVVSYIISSCFKQLNIWIVSLNLALPVCSMPHRHSDVWLKLMDHNCSLDKKAFWFRSAFVKKVSIFCFTVQCALVLSFPDRINQILICLDSVCYWLVSPK